MQDAELSELATQADTLTEIARQVLSDEMRRRSMEPPSPVVQVQPQVSSQSIPPEPVMIRQYRDVPIAALARNALDSAGIESFLVDENLVQMHWFYSDAIGGVKLYVRPEDVADANKVLDDLVQEKLDSGAPAQ
jgi:hypothetical protein